ncbi:uncharacterized protein LOC130442981 [Diorhabda sublineata]|uniref:uncharacterized protein LOC130442981 n=1 Tax=Diorhabda sublineata TaxID=1163346 RepID=UPI0024E17A36|nr:uncharacterized protein LOC130442981 [Diorhabda sublineata]XP_056633383.1 uncharacterized protein LOC130442981 [Diorhabda sublineata]
MIAENLNLFVLYQKDKDEAWGDIYDNGTAIGTLIYLMNDEVDVLIGGYTKTFQKMLFLDCSRSFIQESLIWCTPHEPILLGLKPMIEILPIEGWLGIAIVYFITSLSIWYLSKNNESELCTYKKLDNCFLYTFLMLIGFAAKALPTSNRSRYFTGHFMIFSLFVNILYTTFLTSTIASQKFKEKYRSMEDIYENKLNTYFLPLAEKYFQPYFEDNENYIEGVPISLIQKKWNTCKNATICMEAVLGGNDNALLTTELFKEYLFTKYGQLHKSRYKPYCLKKPILSLPINIVMRKGFPLLFLFVDLIDRIQSAGFISKWEKDILERRKVNIYSDKENLMDYNTIKFKNLVTIFEYMLFGILFAIIVFIIEVVFYRRICW